MVASVDYRKFIHSRTQWQSGNGLSVESLPTYLFDFQTELVGWALRKGRAAIFADCGLGKSACELAWGDKIVRATNKPVLLLTPLAVGLQMVKEADKFGVEVERSRDGTYEGKPRIIISNYQQLHKFDSSQFAGVICDESSCIKDAKSATKAAIVEFMRTIQYRLLCTATAAPNDYWELGTSSEALGYLGFRDMITTFFKQETSKDHLGWGRTKYRFRGHAEHPFWSWVCSWAKCIRKPSDLGFEDEGYDLPPLVEHDHIVSAAKLREGMLFSMPAKNLQEQREERRNSIPERVAICAELVEKHQGASVVWCELNDEGDALEKEIPNSKQVKGSQSDEEKEELLNAFSTGELERLICKPKIGAWGLNWQHCHNVLAMVSHSYEQYYQAVRRCWRYGQNSEVNVHRIISEGELGVLRNLTRKARQADAMFESLRNHMNDPQHILKIENFPEREQIPSWV